MRDKKIWSHFSVSHFSVGIRLEGSGRDGAGKAEAEYLGQTWSSMFLRRNDSVAPLLVAAPPDFRKPFSAVASWRRGVAITLLRRGVAATREPRNCIVPTWRSVLPRLGLVAAMLPAA